MTKRTNTVPQVVQASEPLAAAAAAVAVAVAAVAGTAARGCATTTREESATEGTGAAFPMMMVAMVAVEGAAAAQIVATMTLVARVGTASHIQGTACPLQGMACRHRGMACRLRGMACHLQDMGCHLQGTDIHLRAMAVLLQDTALHQGTDALLLACLLAGSSWLTPQVEGRTSATDRRARRAGHRRRPHMAHLRRVALALGHPHRAPCLQDGNRSPTQQADGPTLATARRARLAGTRPQLRMAMEPQHPVAKGRLLRADLRVPQHLDPVVCPRAGSSPPTQLAASRTSSTVPPVPQAGRRRSEAANVCLS